MKIISGKFKGRVLKGFNINGTRPTMDRVKESLFAMIQDYVKDSTILDLYSGTGNLAIEALSNGAKQAYLVDNNIIAINTIKENVNMLNIDNVNIIKGDALKVLTNLIEEKIVFNIIFLDPPYQTNEIDKSLTKINDNLNILDNNGIIVVETQINIDFTKYNNLYIYKERGYGDKKIYILKKNN